MGRARALPRLRGHAGQRPNPGIRRRSRIIAALLDWRAERRLQTTELLLVIRAHTPQPPAAGTAARSQT